MPRRVLGGNSWRILNGIFDKRDGFDHRSARFRPDPHGQSVVARWWGGGYSGGSERLIGIG